MTEYAGDSLFKILRDQNEHGVKIIQPEHVQFIIYQILRALKYIHSANVSFFFSLILKFYQFYEK